MGYIKYSTIKTAAPGQTVIVNAILEKGLREYFIDDAAASILWKWQPRPYCNWSISGGAYIANDSLSGWNYSAYNYNWNSSKYTVKVRMNRSAGSIFNSNSVLLTTSSNATNINGYLFNYTADGWYSIWRYNNSNWYTGSTTAVPIIGWTASSKVNDGLGADNILKIVRNGSTYTYYINDLFLASFTDTIHNPAYVFIGCYCGGQYTRLNFDYVVVDIDEKAGSIPAEAVKESQITTNEHPGYHKH